MVYLFLWHHKGLQSYSERQLQFLGKDRIDHTPKDEKFKVVAVNAFDVTGIRTKTNYKKVDSDLWKENYDFDSTGKRIRTNYRKVSLDVWRESCEINSRTINPKLRKFFAVLA